MDSFTWLFRCHLGFKWSQIEVISPKLALLSNSVNETMLLDTQSRAIGKPLVSIFFMFNLSPALLAIIHLWYLSDLSESRFQSNCSQKWAKLKLSYKKRNFKKLKPKIGIQQGISHCFILQAPAQPSMAPTWFPGPLSLSLAWSLTLPHGAHTLYIFLCPGPWPDLSWHLLFLVITHSLIFIPTS